MVTVFHNYNQRNFAMANIVPDLSNPSEILRLIREMPVVSPRCKVEDSRLYPTVHDYRLEQQFPGARCIGMKCHDGECRIALVMSDARYLPGLRQTVWQLSRIRNPQASRLSVRGG